MAIKDQQPGTPAAPNAPVGGSKFIKTFEFILESTEKNEKLYDTYVGVEFSILVSLNKIYNFIKLVQINNRIPYKKCEY